MAEKSMTQRRLLSEQRIIEYLNIYYNIQVTALARLLLGADMNASVYRAEARDGKAYFVKLKYGYQHDMGVALLNLLHDEGIQQIIPTIKTSQGLSTLHIDQYTLIVYPYIENQNGFSQILTDDQ